MSNSCERVQCSCSDGACPITDWLLCAFSQVFQLCPRSDAPICDEQHAGTATMHRVEVGSSRRASMVGCSRSAGVWFNERTRAGADVAACRTFRRQDTRPSARLWSAHLVLASIKTASHGAVEVVSANFGRCGFLAAACCNKEPTPLPASWPCSTESVTAGHRATRTPRSARNGVGALTSLTRLQSVSSESPERHNRFVRSRAANLKLQTKLLRWQCQ